MGFVEWTPRDAADGRAQGVQDLLDRLPKGDGQAPQDRNFPNLATGRGSGGRAPIEAAALVEKSPQGWRGWLGPISCIGVTDVASACLDLHPSGKGTGIANGLSGDAHGVRPAHVDAR